MSFCRKIMMSMLFIIEAYLQDLLHSHFNEIAESWLKNNAWSDCFIVWTDYSILWTSDSVLWTDYSDFSCEMINHFIDHSCFLCELALIETMSLFNETSLFAIDKSELSWYNLTMMIWKFINSLNSSTVQISSFKFNNIWDFFQLSA